MKPRSEIDKAWKILIGVGVSVAAFLGVLVLVVGFLYWRSHKSHQSPPVASADPRLQPASNPTSATPRILPRTPDAKPNEIDLSTHYNFPLNKNWSDVRGNDLAELPTGLQTFAGTEFDVRGLIQVAKRSQKHPPSVTEIPVGKTCTRLHFLHSAIGADNSKPGTKIGRYVVNYANGEQQEIPLQVGFALGDWWESANGDSQQVVIAWEGQNAKSRAKGKKIRLYKYSWENPLPSAVIASIDFHAESAGPSPFLVALTIG